MMRNLSLTFLLSFSPVSPFFVYPFNSKVALGWLGIILFSFHNKFTQIFDPDQFIRSLHTRNLSLEDDFMKSSVPGEECSRTCVENQPKVCHFVFRLEHYQVLGGFVSKLLLHCA